MLDEAIKEYLKLPLRSSSLKEYKIMETEKNKKWVMPDWMEKYRELIVNTGGNSIEELVNDDGTNSNVFNNAPRALICVAVKSQVSLLTILHKKGLLK